MPDTLFLVSFFFQHGCYHEYIQTVLLQTCVVLSTMCVPLGCWVWWRPPISAGHCPFRYEEPTPLIVSRDPVLRNADVAGLNLIGLGLSTETENETLNMYKSQLQKMSLWPQVPSRDSDLYWQIRNIVSKRSYQLVDSKTDLGLLWGHINDNQSINLSISNDWFSKQESFFFYRWQRLVDQLTWSQVWQMVDKIGNQIIMKNLKNTKHSI